MRRAGTHLDRYVVNSTLGILGWASGARWVVLENSLNNRSLTVTALGIDLSVSSHRPGATVQPSIEFTRSSYIAADMERKRCIVDTLQSVQPPGERSVPDAHRRITCGCGAVVVRF